MSKKQKAESLFSPEELAPVGVKLRPLVERIREANDLPVKSVAFSHSTMLPGYPGACTRITVGDVPVAPSATAHVKSITYVPSARLLVIDEKFCLSVDCGNVTVWEPF